MVDANGAEDVAGTGSAAAVLPAPPTDGPQKVDHTVLIAWVAVGVLTLVHLVFVFAVEPTFLELFKAMGGPLPLLTQMLPGAPRFLRVIEVLALGPGLMALIQWRWSGRSRFWLFAPAILLGILLPVEIIALYFPMFSVVSFTQ
jgi:hypothetical protein